MVPNVWINLALSAAFLVGLWMLLTLLRRTASASRALPPSAGDDDADDSGGAVGTCVSEREARLGRRLAQIVGCPLPQALEFIHREVEYAPHQSDDTLLRRAAYHYRRELPEKECPPFGERSRG